LRDIKFFDEEILAVVIIILCSLTTIANHSILSANVVFLNSQFSFGQGSSLADADVVKHCASLDTFDILDEDLILFEAFNRHGHCNRNWSGRPSGIATIRRTTGIMTIFATSKRAPLEKKALSVNKRTIMKWIR
jgi:hypothetical protein